METDISAAIASIVIVISTVVIILGWSNIIWKGRTKKVKIGLTSYFIFSSLIFITAHALIKDRGEWTEWAEVNTAKSVGYDNVSCDLTESIDNMRKFECKALWVDSLGLKGLQLDVWVIETDKGRRLEVVNKENCVD
jgi:hypothetical protein